MSVLQPAKRRRLNESLSILSKPFVSPLKTAISAAVPTDSSTNDSNLSNKPVAPTPTTKSVTVSKLKSLSKHSASISSSKKAQPPSQAAQKEISALELQIRATRRDIDTLNHASQLTASTTDASLQNLTQKWRLAAQAAAEDVFETFKERVDHMGGVAAWRENEKKKYERVNTFFEFEKGVDSGDTDYGFDSQGEELPEAEKEYRKKKKKKLRREMAEMADAEDGFVEREDSAEVRQEEMQDDDTFTMDMMLRSLNIEVDVIGYDKVAQRWIA